MRKEVVGEQGREDNIPELLIGRGFAENENRVSFPLEGLIK